MGAQPPLPALQAAAAAAAWLAPAWLAPARALRLRFLVLQKAAGWPSALRLRWLKHWLAARLPPGPPPVLPRPEGQLPALHGLPAPQGQLLALQLHCCLPMWLLQARRRPMWVEQARRLLAALPLGLAVPPTSARRLEAAHLLLQHAAAVLAATAPTAAHCWTQGHPNS
jgi:hypothetical protein